MQTQTVIRAVDYVPAKADVAEDPDVIAEDVVTRLFGASPDYTRPEYEKLWQEVFDADEDATIAYCREKGIDVLDDAKNPVEKWRDIAVMLKAVDAGLLKKD